jgi:hypothetical protein
MTTPPYGILPEHLRAGMQRYIEHGIETGGFLRAVLENDLVHTFLRADYSMEMLQIGILVSFISDYVPPEAWGSPAKVAAWIAKHAKARAER